MVDGGKRTPVPAPAQEGESFTSRWSRLKKEARERPAEKPEQTPPPVDARMPVPELPAAESLTFDSDYRQFFHPKVGEDVRRAALKKLFSDPHFNVMDGLDVYIDDYSKTEPIPVAMLAGLKQAQNIFQWAKEDAEERRRAEAGAGNTPQGVETGRTALQVPQTQPDAADIPNTKAGETAPASATESKGHS